MRLVGFATILALQVPALLLTDAELRAWDATYTRGSVPQILQDWRRQTQPSSEPFATRRIIYPSDEGATLGQAWDFVLNKKIQSNCIDFDIKTRKFQDANLTFRQATDEETRDITLNTTFSVEGGGGFAGFSGRAGISFGGAKFNHYYSKDVLLVAHASVTSGAEFVSPFGPGDQTIVQRYSIKLLPEMEQLRKTNYSRFQLLCGDGYIASINFGADLYVLLTLHELDEKSRRDLNIEMKGSAGFVNIFTADHKSTIRRIIEERSQKNRLTVQFVQYGGRIGDLPIDFPSAGKKIQGLAKEAFDAPKPTYIVVYPYSDLPGVDRIEPRNSGDLLQTSLRYHKRLLTLHAEILSIEENWFRDRTQQPNDAYYFEERHRLRSENISETRDAVRKEIDLIAKLVYELSRCSDNCDFTRIAQSQEGSQFDDLKFWIRLPLPWNVIAETTKQRIESSKTSSAAHQTPFEQKRKIYADYLYRHWVERQSRARCALFMECLQRSDELRYRDEIRETFYNAEGPGVFEEPSGAKSLLSNVRKVTAAQCYQVNVQNRREGAGDYYFDLYRKRKDSTEELLVRTQPAGSNVDLKLLADDNHQEFRVEAWSGSGAFRKPMNGTIRYIAPLSAEMWFVDRAGGALSLGPNLSIKFTATSAPAPGCQSTR